MSNGYNDGRDPGHDPSEEQLMSIYFGRMLKQSGIMFLIVMQRMGHDFKAACVDHSGQYKLWGSPASTQPAHGARLAPSHRSQEDMLQLSLLPGRPGKMDLGVALQRKTNMQVEFTTCLVFGKWSSKGPCHSLPCLFQGV